MTAGEDSIRFEALTSPRQSWHAAGFRLIVGLLVLGEGTAAVLFWLLGAWPVAGFMGGEMVLVLGLLLAHRRWCNRMAERIVLADGHVRVDRTDRRGRREAVEFDAYWARVTLQARPGRVSELRLAVRGRSVEIGRFLPEFEKADLAEALSKALHAYRSPVFDNAQLRA
jgi:uncharacterized membrane protein